MSDGVLLDTCALIWWTAGDWFDPAATQAVDMAANLSTAYVSPFSAWEVALLQSRGRSPIRLSALDWYDRVLRLPEFVEMVLDATVLVGAWSLPGSGPRDPADRIMISIARKHDLLLVTRDRPILDYGGSGHVRALAC